MENMITFEMIFNHNIMFNTENDELVYNKGDQDIVLREFSIFPELEIDKMEIVAKYSGKAEDVVRNSLNKVVTRIGSVKKTDSEEVKKHVEDRDETQDESSENDISLEKIEEKTQENGGINNKKRSFNIITNRLKVSKQFSIKNNSKYFIFEFKPKDITKFINYVESKKIKIFIDGNEIKPKTEIEFLKEIIPIVQAKIYLK